MAKKSATATDQVPGDEYDETAKPVTACPVPTLVFKRKKSITKQLLKKADGVPVFVKIIGPIYTGKSIAGVPGQEKMAPARLVLVIDLSTGQEMEMIVNKALESALTDNYPDNGFVDLCFEIEQYAITGKRYKGYKVSEIEVE